MKIGPNSNFAAWGRGISAVSGALAKGYGGQGANIDAFGSNDGSTENGSVNSKPTDANKVLKKPSKHKDVPKPDVKGAKDVYT